MTYRNHCNTLTTHEMWNGLYQPIPALINAGVRHIETWGNSREGFTLYSVDSTGIGLRVSGPFTLRRDAVAAAKLAYGDAITVARGRNW